MSKRISVITILLVLLFSCENKRKETESTDVEEDTAELPVVVEDTVLETIQEEPVSEVVRDEAFNDFIYTFGSDTAFQRSRIVFPLPCYEEDTTLKIEREDWVHDELFVKQGYYTLLFDKEEELDQAYDVSQTSAQIEWAMMKPRVVKKYYFERVDGRWMLEAINKRSFMKNKRADFADFLIRFATDSLYQAEHIREPLQFVTTDPDDDFSIIETTLSVEQWFAFKPLLPGEVLSNIIYGGEIADNSTYKILQLKGMENGFLNILFFRQKSNGKWELYKFEDTGN